MTRNNLVHGLIAGVLISAFMLISMNYASYCNGNVSEGTSMLIGYAAMLLAFSLVFMGIRNYRDNYNGGLISFGKAFKVGILIVLIASTIYVISWLIYYFYFDPGFMDKYSAHKLADLRAAGKSQAELDKQAKDLAEMARVYKNPLVTAAFTYVEILPVGLLVTLVSALILKRKSRNAP